MRTRLMAAMVIAVLLIPGAVAAQDHVTDRATDELSVTGGVGDSTADGVVDRQQNRVADRPVDRVTDRARDRLSDRCAEFDRLSDVCCPDRSVDRITDRCPDHLNVRHLIWRLIKAQEWEKLFRLLHRLHIL